MLGFLILDLQAIARQFRRLIANKERNDFMDDRRGPQVKFPPPMMFISMILVAMALELAVPMGFKLPEPVHYMGLLLPLVGSLALLKIAINFRQKSTNIEPWKPTSTVIVDGIYAYSRNPIYLLFCSYPIGIGLFVGKGWVILSTLPSLVLVYQFAIAPEERYLTQKFGDDYQDYCRKVPRWLLWF